ncbi:hypothetical protein L6452_13969 [Arctium lappa]|uniref:Uncharacterized protein n=1 Tax=Arctium lappa TaxID=4217 RepID=A0ACB9CJP1_ARCLA|nr:hypothetical protein L6452_13969 [Arctium lappa]
MYFSTGLIFLLTALDIVVYYLQKQQEEDNAEQKNSSPSSSSDQRFVRKEDHVERKDSSSSSLEKQCRRFSLAEIKLATHDFDDAFVIGKVLCGRPAVDITLDEKQHGLAAWAKDCVEEGTIDQFVDPCLRGEVSTCCLKEFSQIAYKCLLWSPKDRPTMTEVVAQIEFVLALALQKHDGVTVVEKVRLLFLKLPAVHTKKYRNRQKWSNANKSKLSILDKVTSTIAEGRSEGMKNSFILVDPTKAAAKGSSKDINKGVTTEEPTMTMIGGSSEYVKAAAVPTEAECHHAARMLKAQPLSSQIGTNNLKIFTFDELHRATRNFRPSAMLGYSDGESVYKGWVDRASYAPSVCGVGIVVAIKILNTDKVQILKEWQAEVNRGKFSHPRLVKLLGYCSEDGRLLLVHEYVPKRNLVELLSCLQ